jgi:hypothetical protein
MHHETLAWIGLTRLWLASWIYINALPFNSSSGNGSFNSRNAGCHSLDMLIELLRQRSQTLIGISISKNASLKAGKSRKCGNHGASDEGVAGMGCRQPSAPAEIENQPNVTALLEN